jgi:hypothetical protein
MKHRFSIISLLFFCVFYRCFSQNIESKNKSKSNQNRTEKKSNEGVTNLKIAYLGAIKQPGFKIGLEFPLEIYQDTWLLPNGLTNYKVRGKLLATNFSMYHHKNFHTNMMYTAEYLKRTSYKSGFFIDWAPGIGLSRTYFDAPTYKRDAKGNIKKAIWAGDNYLLTTLAGSIGQDIEMGNSDVRIYTRANLLLMAPFHKTILPRLAIEIGTIINIGY